MRSRDGQVPSRADGHSRTTRQRFWPVEGQPDVTGQPEANRGLLYTWRRQIEEGLAEPHSLSGATEARQARQTAKPPAMQHNGRSLERRVVPGVIEIDLPNGICVRVDNQVDPVALRRVLDALMTR